jgi:hypothetical protein
MKGFALSLLALAMAAGMAAAQAPIADWQPYAQDIRRDLQGEYQAIFREAEGALKHPFIGIFSKAAPCMNTISPRTGNHC